jgi:hypothetical protein
VHKKVVENLHVVACPIDVATNINIPLWTSFVSFFKFFFDCMCFGFMFPCFAFFKNLSFLLCVCLNFLFEFYIYVCFLFACLFQQNLKFSCFAFLYSRF